MNLSQIIYRVGELGVKNAVTDLDIVEFINEAQREVADRKLWSFMHDYRTATMVSGQTKAPLGVTFKQLGTEESPVSFNYSNYQLPVKVLSRARIDGMGIWPWLNGPFSLSIPGGYMPAMVTFLEQDAGGEWTLNVPVQYIVTQDITFNVSAYYYPDNLTVGTATNAFTNDGNLCQAIVNIAKERAYSNVETDSQKATAARMLAEQAIERAIYSDGQKSMGGRTMRM